MSTHDKLYIARNVLAYALIAWYLPAFLNRWLPECRIRTALAWLRNELTLFVWPIIIGKFFVSVAYFAPEGPNFRAALSLLLDIVVWWVWRKSDDDDDRWKRRGKKLAEKVSVTADGKLAVVPQ